MYKEGLSQDQFVHGDIRHLEKQKNLDELKESVHGDIRHLENPRSMRS